jgi:predicted nucleic-acid-binding protein
VIGLDANILLRWLIEEDGADKHSERAAEIILESGETFFVNNIVLAETVWVLKNKAGQSRKVIEQIVARLMASANVELEDDDTVRRALDAFVQGRADFADYLIAEVNVAAGCTTTLTFNRKAAQHRSFSQPGP